MRMEVQLDGQLPGHEALERESGSQPMLDPELGFRQVSPGLDLSSLGEMETTEIDVEHDRCADRRITTIDDDSDIDHGADLDAVECDRRADLQSLERSVEVGDDGLGPAQEAVTAQDDGTRDREQQRAQDERSDECLIRLVSHSLPHVSSPRVRKRPTFEPRDSCRSFHGGPPAVIVLAFSSRKTEFVAIAKMLASSWVTITTVAPRLSRSSTIRSSRARELIGSRPDDGSSKNRMSGSSAIARARPARLRMPPLTSDGYKSSKPASPTSASLSEAMPRIEAGGRSVNCSSGSLTFSASVIELQSAPSW